MADVRAWLRGDRAAPFWPAAAAPFPQGHFSGHAESAVTAEVDAREAESPPPLLDPPEVFAVGDRVAWKGADAELPRGTVGVVVRVHPQDGDVEAAFAVVAGQAPQAFTFAAHRLERCELELNSPALGSPALGVRSAPPCGSEPPAQADDATQRMEAELNDFSAWM